jgi:hypothetical protein
MTDRAELRRAFERERGNILRALNDSCALSNNERRVAVRMLSEHANFDRYCLTRKIVAWPSPTFLATKLGLSKSQVQRIRQTLILVGVLNCDDQRGGRGRGAMYEIRPPSTWRPDLLPSARAQAKGRTGGEKGRTGGEKGRTGGEERVAPCVRPDSLEGDSLEGDSLEGARAIAQVTALAERADGRTHRQGEFLYPLKGAKKQNTPVDAAGSARAPELHLAAAGCTLDAYEPGGDVVAWALQHRPDLVTEAGTIDPIVLTKFRNHNHSHSLEDFDKECLKWLCNERPRGSGASTPRQSVGERWRDVFDAVSPTSSPAPSTLDLAPDEWAEPKASCR